MKNYDDDVARLQGVTRSFTLRGIEFIVKPLMPHDAISDLADLQTGRSDASISALLISVISRTLVPNSREAWDTLMASEQEVPITLEVLMKIADDLVSEDTGRPTQPPSPSGTTGGPTGTNSTDDSVSKEEVASKVAQYERL